MIAFLFSKQRSVEIIYNFTISLAYPGWFFIVNIENQIHLLQNQTLFGKVFTGNYYVPYVFHASNFCIKEDYNIYWNVISNIHDKVLEREF